MRPFLKSREAFVPSGHRELPTKAKQAELTKLVRTDAMHDLVTSLHNRSSDAEIKMLDAVYWMEGCS